VKTAPHFGHLIFASFLKRLPQPNEENDKITNAKKDCSPTSSLPFTSFRQ